MIKLLTIAADEWRYWFRSQLAFWSILAFVVLLVTIATLNVLKVSAEHHKRIEHQKTAEETFLEQPDRHPHRMVHYGHYAFRAPTPLAMIDPGLDAVTGQAIFLEGHRQNSASFDESAASADLGGLSWLSPALVYQWFAPLLLILLGYGSVVRERESSTLATLLSQNVSGWEILIGKILAMLSMSCVLILPLFLTATFAEGAFAGLILSLSYLVYMGIWAILTIAISASVYKRATILTIMLSFWLCICLLIPSIAVDLESQLSTHKGKVQSDLLMLSELRKLGDGHNSNDPAFAKIRSNLLAQYQVENIEDLPVNLRGIVAKYSEEKLTQVLNEYANERMTTEVKQASRLENYGWLSPALAIANVSRAIAGTDLHHYHQFLVETESLRYDFVQGLNEVHSKQLSYSDDINRSSDKEAEKRTRISATNWQLLDSYQFKPAQLSTRIRNAESSLIIMLVWSIVLVAFVFIIGKFLKP
ncbi:ABC transporter permease [Marinicella sp. W31]|uniref:ABC transporter permease n=1 Tax=Marinicella sp. W31 TaxID=3023713 RepID=UPI0037567E39